MQLTNLYIPPKYNNNCADIYTLPIIRPQSEFKLLDTNSKTYNLNYLDYNNNTSYLSQVIYSELDEYIEIMDGCINMNDNVNFYYNEFLKEIVSDNDDEEQIISNEFINNVYFKSELLFNGIMDKILLTNDINLFCDVLRSLTFTDISFNNNRIKTLMEKCITSNNNSAISRVITILEILNDKEIINNYADINIKSKSLSRRLKNLI